MPRTRRALLAALGTGLGTGIAGCTGTGTTDTTTSTAEPTSSTSTTTTTTATTVAPGDVRWRLDAGAESPELVLRDDRVYVGGDAVYGLAPDGSTRWRYGTDAPVQSLVVADRVYATAGEYPDPAGRNFALHAVDGGERDWQFARDGAGQLSAPAVGADGVYVATRDDYLQPSGETLYGLSAGGDRRWSDEVGDAEVGFGGDTLFASYPRHLVAFEPDGAERWNRTVEDLYPTLLGVRGDTAFAFWGGTLRALALADGTDRWTSAPAGPTALAGGRLYTVTDDAVAMALDPASGEPQWRQSVPKTASLAVEDGTVYVLGETVTALDAADGTVTWTRELGREPFDAAVGSGVAAVWVGGELRALDAADGSTRWTFVPDTDADHPHVRQMAVGDGTVYLALGGGTVYALRI